MNNITILTEAGKNIGLGHYTRCSSLYQVLTKAGNFVRFVVYENDYQINDRNIQSMNWLDSIDSLTSISINEIAIVDSYLADESIYSLLRERYHKVVAIDDYNRMIYPADIVINPNVFFEDIDYSNQKAICIGGKNYVILRPEFKENKPKVCSDEVLRNILITIGGSDFRNLLPKLICICDQINDIDIIVIDPENKIGHLQNIKVLPTQTAAQMTKLMQSTDVVISACGQTLHELVALQMPTIGICLDIDQIPNQNYYVRHGFLMAAIQWNDENIEKIIKEQINIYSLPVNRKTVAEICKSLISKNGVEKIAKYINTI
jgi:spore coat polysaccharide biosynthesis predicted glycosyltransferase SpsG